MSTTSASADTTRRGLEVLVTGMREQRAMFSLALFGSVVYGALTVADAWVLGWATDHVIRPSFADGELVVGAAAVAVLMFVSVAIVRGLGIVARRLIGGLVYFRLMADYRRRVTRRYLELPLRWHQRHPTGQLLSNANADVEATWAVMMPLPMALGVVAMLVVSVVVMLLADWVLTLVGLVIFPLLFLINVGYQRLLSPRVTRAQALRADVSAVAHESFDGALVVKALGREADETDRFAKTAHDLRDANIAAGRVRSVFDPVLEALPNLGVLLVVVLGVERVLSGATEPGDVVQVAYLFIVVGFPVRAFGWVLGELPRSVVGWNRVTAVLNAQGSMPYGDETLANAPARLSLHEVGFGHGGSHPQVLSGLDLEVEPSRVVALVGLTGAGKSTLASLVTRLIDPQQGTIALNGIDLRDLTHASLAASIALVPQQTFIFDDTVRDNIALGADTPDDEIWHALETAQADAFVRALPDGLDSQLGERGTTLSGGQRQRLALARALVRRPRLLVMDDATSAVDPEVEQRILHSLAGETTGDLGPTVLVVAYRKATIGLADEVVFLSDGRIADRGTHDELSLRNAAYRDLVDAYDQARDGEPVDE
ncbi:ABC transporter ATP-binding protein [Solicola gregarius]|uniref:ABC transporter ATP-binding protein/permease n=1 Tax=Solicola gregarius TaxID=2908642 RepID=A0AA46TI79_9ACTN|nr:ABC transporter ATP-binding protein [Solicola gregarius]UYM05329.1 ABC transporter ATP-binding protein/permease [Solicola gregarius]